jgi:hypothetical protein
LQNFRSIRSIPALWATVAAAASCQIDRSLPCALELMLSEYRIALTAGSAPPEQQPYDDKHFVCGGIRSLHAKKARRGAGLLMTGRAA